MSTSTWCGHRNDCECGEMPEPAVSRDTYLGDGLYAAFDGYQVRLYTERGNGTHEVFLDDATLVKFEAFVASLRKRSKESR